MFQKRILNAGVIPTAIHNSTSVSRMVIHARRLVPMAPSKMPLYTSIGFKPVRATITPAQTTSDKSTAIMRISQLFHVSIPSRLEICIRGSLFVTVLISLLILFASCLCHHKSDLFFCSCSSIYNTADLAAAKHQNAVAKLQEHIQVFPYADHRCPLLFLLI